MEGSKDQFPFSGAFTEESTMFQRRYRMRGKKTVLVVAVALLCMVGLIVSACAITPEEMRSEMEKANIDWRSCAGQTITVNLSRIPHAEAMVDLITEFEQLTGLRVNFEILSDEEYWNKLTIDFASGAGFFDVVYTGNIFYNYIAAGWLEPLGKYLNDPTYTDLDWYDPDDFWKIAWEVSMWDGKTIGPNTYGIGDIYHIPFTSESTILSYRKDLFAKYGLTVPTSWPELLDTAKKLTRDGGYGFISRGSRKWSTIAYNGYSNGYYAYGGGDFDQNLNPIFDRAPGVEFTELWGELCRETTPPGFLSTTWEDARSLFMSGANYGMCMEADTFLLSWENEDISEVVGKLGYSHTPGGPAGHCAGYWTWNIGINSAISEKDKKASWLFVQWATSKPFLLRATADFLTFPPTRKSVWFHPSVVAMTEKWDNGSYRKVFRETMEYKYTRVPWTISPEMTTINELWAEAVQKVIMKEVTAKEALTALGKKAEEIMEKYKK